MPSSAVPHTGPYKLTPATCELVLGLLRDGFALTEAATVAGVTPSGIYRFCRRATPEAAAFAEDIDRARVAGRARRGSRPVRVAQAMPSVEPASDAGACPVEIMGIRVEPVRVAVEIYEAAFLLGVSINQVRKLIRHHRRGPGGASSGVVTAVGNRRRLRIEWLLDRPWISERPIPAVLAARLIEGQLEVPRPMSDSAVPAPHIEALRGLL